MVVIVYPCIQTRFIFSKFKLIHIMQIYTYEINIDCGTHKEHYTLYAPIMYPLFFSTSQMTVIG